MCKGFNDSCDSSPLYAHLTTTFTLWKYFWSLSNTYYKNYFSRNIFPLESSSRQYWNTCTFSVSLSLCSKFLSKDGHRNFELRPYPEVQIHYPVYYRDQCVDHIRMTVIQRKALRCGETKEIGRFFFQLRSWDGAEWKMYSANSHEYPSIMPSGINVGNKNGVEARSRGTEG